MVVVTKPFLVLDETNLKPRAGTFLSNGEPDKRGGRLSMNHSIYSADRMTHLKIVTVALVAGFVVAMFGVSARIDSGDGTRTARVIKAGKPVMLSGSDVSTIR
jgi:hypothetical protein